MVLLQLISPDKKKKKLLSVDKEAEFGAVCDMIAQKLDLSTIEGMCVCQIDDRDGDSVAFMYGNTKLSSLPRLGGAHYLWVKEPDEDTPDAAIVGADPAEAEAEPAPVAKKEEAAPVSKEEPAAAQEGEAADEDEEPEEPEEPTFKMPENKEGKAKKKSPPKPPAAKRESPAKGEEEEDYGPPGQDPDVMKGALSTETYEVDVGKYRPFTKAVIDDKKDTPFFKRYPIQYANVRRKAPRVTTLSPDASDNKAPDCLRESYNWTAVGKYKAMTDSSGKVGKSKQGTFKNPSTYPRFAADSAEIQLKKLFAQQMQMREKAKLSGEAASERRPKERKALEDALKSDPELQTA